MQKANKRMQWAVLWCGMALSWHHSKYRAERVCLNWHRKGYLGAYVERRD